MSQGFEYWIGSRYVRSRSNNSFVSLISAISMLGIAIAVMVLIVVMSVVNGFERELKDRLLAMTAHASIEGVDGKLPASADLIDLALENSRVSAAAPYVDGQALLVFEAALSGAELRGIDPPLENAVSGIGGVMQAGSLRELAPGDFNVVLGVELAEAMQVGVGDKVTVTLAQGIVTPAGVVPRTKRFTVSGIFRVGMYEFDRRLAFINIRDGGCDCARGRSGEWRTRSGRRLDPPTRQFFSFHSNNEVHTVRDSDDGHRRSGLQYCFDTGHGC